ncbi:MAG: YbhB/YbcL family Raf kinase inhibitor-like protein [Candidatus Omnitrophota bacterium]|jgi:Raf kinase inhibitor-like YbhB/YbcL family protein
MIKIYHRSFMILCILFIAILLFAGGVFALELESGAFEDNGYIPALYTCKGDDISPALNWSDVPKGTKSFVLIMDDPDAPLGTWIHWVAYDIPGDLRRLEQNVPRRMTLDNGTKQGINSFRRIGYGGPCPPPGPAHRYVFKLYAVDTKLELLPGATKGAVLRAIQGHILDNTQLTGLFKR